MSKPKILVIGDSFLDEYLYCSFVKENPEAEGSVYKIDRKQYFLGGAAAVANMCASLGVHVELATAIGHDQWYKTFIDLLSMHKVPWRHQVTFSHPYRTIVKTRYIVEDQLFPDRFDDEYPAEKIENTLVYDNIIRYIPEYDIVLICDYGKGFVDDYLLEKLPSSRIILVDPAIGTHWYRYRNCSLIKANEREAKQAILDRTYNESDHLATTLANMWSKSVVITRGEQGIEMCHFYSQREDIVATIKAVQTDKKDICGAGDTVFAVLGVYLARGYALDVACRYAVHYAAQQIQSFGIRPLTPIKELENASSTKT